MDQGYDGATDALEDADNERDEASIRLDRESTAIFRVQPRIKWTNGGRFGTYARLAD